MLKFVSQKIIKFYEAKCLDTTIWRCVSQRRVNSTFVFFSGPFFPSIFFTHPPKTTPFSSPFSFIASSALEKPYKPKDEKAFLPSLHFLLMKLQCFLRLLTFHSFHSFFFQCSFFFQHFYFTFLLKSMRLRRKSKEMSSRHLCFFKSKHRKESNFPNLLDSFLKLKSFKLNVCIPSSFIMEFINLFCFFD